MKAWSQSSENEIRRWQTRKLRAYLENVILPFSPYYRDLFRKLGIQASSIKSWEHLSELPFTSKADLSNSPEHPQRNREFIIVPDKTTLARRPSTLWRALTRGRKSVAARFEHEFRPIFMTSTTGRSADPVAFLYSQHDLDNLATAGRRTFEVSGARPDLRILNLFPYAPHLAFWQTH